MSPVEFMARASRRSSRKKEGAARGGPSSSARTHSLGGKRAPDPEARSLPKRTWLNDSLTSRTISDAAGVQGVPKGIAVRDALRFDAHAARRQEADVRGSESAIGTGVVDFSNCWSRSQRRRACIGRPHAPTERESRDRTGNGAGFRCRLPTCRLPTGRSHAAPTATTRRQMPQPPPEGQARSRQVERIACRELNSD